MVDHRLASLRHRSAVLSCVLAITLIAGCGGESHLLLETDGRAQVAAEKSAAAAESGDRDPAAVDRRIIYTATVHLVVQEFADAEQQIPQLVKEHGGYLARADVDRTSGVHRSGHWQARIPIDRYETFLKELAALGLPESLSQSAQDVTEEFVDLQARIANKQKLEQRILDLLGKSDDRIENIIEVERELARVRGEIEQMEGRLRLLTNRTELTTVDVYVRADRDYVPPQAPSFAGKIKDAWNQSVVTLLRLLEGTGIFLVFLAPWLLTGGVMLVLLLLIKRLRRRSRRADIDRLQQERQAVESESSADDESNA